MREDADAMTRERKTPHSRRERSVADVPVAAVPVADAAIIESTLREGEQFANAFFTLDEKLEIARLLDAFGVSYLELTSPAASPGSRRDCAAIAKLGLRAKVLTHTRCHLEDARMAVDTGVDGIDVVFGTSSYLRRFSHGKSIDEIIDTAAEVISFIKSQGLEVRFSSEDSFRSDLVDLLRIYRAVAEMGVDRVGIADTVGVASPLQVHELVRTLRSVVSCDIEFHGHDDTGCAVANAFCALEAGATHVDTSVLGIGERNGITPLGGLVARLYAHDAEAIRRRYDLSLLREIENYVAGLVGVDVPFNNAITGFAAFTHKAGIHAKAILNDPSTYEILRPEDFGLERYLHVAHRLTGWNAIKARSEQLRLTLSDAQIKEITAHVKALADEKPLSLSDIDALLRQHGSPEKEAALRAEEVGT
jgi:homocitrate synthase